MNKKTKVLISIICIIATIFIIIGGGLTLKELMIEEDMLNIADDPAYLKVTFNPNGATMVDSKSIRCKIIDASCSITLPDAKRENGEVLGFSDNKDSLEAKYKVGESIELNDSLSLYVISYKTNTLTINENGVDYLEKNTESCNVYNSNRDCTVILPRYNKVGYENKGYSTNKDSLTGFINAGEEYKLSTDETIYPIYSTSSRKTSLNISKTFTYQNSFIEVEEGCMEGVYQEYLKYLDEIKKYVPFLLLGNKITFVTDKSFNTIWGANYVGMNYGPKSLRSVDIRCSNNSFNDYYATMVHEMAHSWDFYYATKLGDNISSQSEIINLYNKYKDKSNRPFRDYSYSNIYEYVADMMRYYYFKYYVPRVGFKNLLYPSDIKKSLEKYICISKNDYDDSKCK